MRPLRVAALFTLPYLLLGLAWAGSNPPGAAPEELHHLVKAIGMGAGDIGAVYDGPPLEGSAPIHERNASLARVITIPAELSPAGFDCTKFQPTVTANCLPDDGAGQPQGDTPAVSAVGAYPPLTYALPGLLARTADDPRQAFYLARAGFLAMSTLLLLLGAWVLVRGLGGRSLLGAYVALTPMSVFCTAIVGTSGVEVAAAFAVGAVVAVVVLRPAAAADNRVQLALGVAGAALATSRPIGVVTLALAGILLAVRLGPRRVAHLLRRPSPALVAGLVLLLAASASTAVWEVRYDNPVRTGTVFSGDAWRVFQIQSFDILRSAVGVFGYLDTPLPKWAIGTWLVLLATIGTLALVVSQRADRWSVAALLVAAFTTAYVTYATVFYPISAGIQGRHLLGIAVLTTVLAGAAVVDRLAASDLREVLPRLSGALGVLAGLIQAFAVYWNLRRYAVGADGPIFFLGDSRWNPPGGALPWLLLALAGGSALAVHALREGRERVPTDLPFPPQPATRRV